MCSIRCCPAGDGNSQGAHTAIGPLLTHVREVGRSALPTGCASPASRASSEGGEMLTFAHIPTGTTVNKAIDVDVSKSRGVAPATAPTMIGAEIATGGATP